MTFFYFSHYLQAWLLPPGLHFFVVLLGVLTCLYSRKIGGFLITLGVLSLGLFSLPIVAYPLLNSLQDRYPILQVEDLKNNQSNVAIVVLGGGNTVRAEYGYKETVSDMTLHRVNYGAYLQLQTHLPIAVSGGKTSILPEAELMAKILDETFHIKVDALEDQSLTTADESQFLKPLLKRKQWKKIVLVTSAWHMPRSVYIFQCAGIPVIPAPMGHYVYGPGYSLLSFFPNMDALYASSLAMHEYVGLFWYRMRYGKSCIRVEA